MSKLFSKISIKLAIVPHRLLQFRLPAVFLLIQKWLKRWLKLRSQIPRAVLTPAVFAAQTPVFEARNLSYLEPTNVFVSTIWEQKIFPQLRKEGQKIIPVYDHTFHR